MDLIVRTPWGARVQNSLLIDMPLVVDPNTSLNTKFGAQTGVALQSADRSTMKFACIGNGGHRMVMGPNNIPIPKSIQHKCTDAALFNHLPFVLRLPSNDLGANDRAKYAMRVGEVHGGISYIAYYLKRLDKSSLISALELKAVTGGVTTTTNYASSSANLNPSPPELDSNGVNVVTGDYLSITTKLPFSMTEAETTELLNVSNILYGTDDAAIISEIGFVTGVDKQITVNPGTGNQFTFNEVIGAQIATFLSQFIAVKFNNGVVNIVVDFGATEPLLDIA